MEQASNASAPTPLDVPEEDASALEGAEEEAEVSPLANVQTVNAGVFQRRVEKAFHQAAAGRLYSMDTRLLIKLQPLITIGDEYAFDGEWANAQAVYESIALKAVEYCSVAEDAFDLSWVLSECCWGLAQCLDSQARLPEHARLDAPARLRLLKSLYAQWQLDSGGGDNELATQAADGIARNVTPDERGKVIAWLQGEPEPKDGTARDFHHAKRAQFLFLLKIHSEITNEEKLAAYLERGMYADAADLLLTLGRVDEAMQIARAERLDAHELTVFAAKMLEMGSDNAAQALRFVEQLQAEAAGCDRTALSEFYLHWLAGIYALHNQPDKALDAEKRLFDAQPDYHHYHRVKDAARLPGNPSNAWTRLRPRLIAALETSRQWHDLAAIYVLEEQARAALDALRAYDKAQAQWRGEQLHARVASVAEADFPDEARVIYQFLAENLIERRGRENYQLAASYLSRAKDLAGRANRLVEWDRYFTALRDNNNRLPALKEELRARKLL